MKTLGLGEGCGSFSGLGVVNLGLGAGEFIMSKKGSPVVQISCFLVPFCSDSAAG